jgi:putative transposase
MREWAMPRFLMLLVEFLVELLHSRRNLLLENLALRRQLTALSHKHSRSCFNVSDRIFWVLLQRFWSGWRKALVIVQPSTVIGWHRTGFKLYWKWISRKHVRVGRKPTSCELREMILRMIAENRTWGAPRFMAS